MNTEQVNNDRKKIRVANISFFAAVFIVGIKLFATLISGSIGVLSELLHSSTDLIATIATILSIRYSAKPPDKDHHYGHDKIESFSALFQVAILVFICAYLIYESIDRIISPVEIHLNVFVFSAILICIFIDWHRSRALMKVARETNSQALEADSIHFSSDILSSIVVLIGMVFTQLNISQLADPISAIIVSIIIIYTTISLSKRAIGSLLDRVPEGILQNIEQKITAIKGVEGIKSLRLRGSGTKIFIDMVILIARTKSFSAIHELTDVAEKLINSLYPNADIVIHSEPIETKEETLNDKVRLVVSDRGFKCHDIFSHRISEDIITELHVEIENTNDLIKAHDIISELEEQIRNKIPLITKVKVHLDEPSEILFDTIDITESSNEIIRHIKSILDDENSVEDYHDIRIFNSAGKIRVSLSCLFNTVLSFDEVHDFVTILESRIYLHLKNTYSNLSNVIIHAEPLNKE